MAKLTQAAVKDLAEQYAAAAMAVQKAESARDRAVTPLMERHAEEMAAATAKHDRKIAELTASANDLYFEVMAWLEAQPKSLRLETEHAIAELNIASITKAGPRVVEAKAFIAKAESQKKDPWTCIKVEVGKAEKLLGPKDIDAVSKRNESVVESRVATLEVK